MIRIPHGIRLAGVALVLTLLILVTLKRNEKSKPTAAEDDLRIAENIFDAREKEATLKMGGRLGLHILQNDVASLKTDETLSLSDEAWFQTLRALFIAGKANGLPPETLDQLLMQSLIRFEKNHSTKNAKSTFHQTEIERLPSPLPESGAQKILQGWLFNPKQPLPLKRLALFKLAAQTPDPSPRVIEAFVSILRGSDPSPDFISVIEAVRSPSVRKTLLQAVLPRTKSMAKLARVEVVKALSRNIRLIPEDYKKVRSMAASLIKADSEMEIESGLRAMSTLIEYRALDPGESDTLKTWLDGIHEAKRTPLIRAAIQGILVKIGRKPD